MVEKLKWQSLGFFHLMLQLSFHLIQRPCFHKHIFPINYLRRSQLKTQKLWKRSSKSAAKRGIKEFNYQKMKRVFNDIPELIVLFTTCKFYSKRGNENDGKAKGRNKSSN